jgi:hypothetical protein
LIREKKVMLDKDLAELYNVTTGVLNQAVKRNIARFPDDFMFQVTKEEFDNLISQFGTSSWEDDGNFQMLLLSKVWLCYQGYCIVNEL